MSGSSVETEAPIDAVVRAVLRRLVDDGALPDGEARDLARRDGVDPAALIDTLAALGVTIHDGTIALADDMEPLDAYAIRGQLSPTTAAWLRALNIYLITDSTNSRMMARAARGTIEGEADIAEAQSAGRRRRGRQWNSPFGRNNSLSLGLRMPLPAAEVTPLSLVVGLAVVDALMTSGVPGLGLKWPNDVMLERRKLGGILIELARADATSSELVVGVGLNLVSNPQMASRIEQPIAAVADAGPMVARNLVAARLIGAIHAFASRFATHGFEPMRGAWETYNIHQGERISVTGGGRLATGRMIGVDARGALLLDTSSGVQALTGGEISVRREADHGAGSVE
jgi:BirA family transcriptional regulator, biotin operon repressor / biotin---[acetyl-CoA-carboxylase] ligase